MAYYAPFLDPDGQSVVMMKATTGPETDSNWSKIDDEIYVGSDEIVSLWAVEDSSDIHVATQQRSGAVLYHVFHPATDLWTTRCKYVATIGDTDFGPDAVAGTRAACSLALRADGDVVIVAAYDDGTNRRLRVFTSDAGAAFVNRGEAGNTGAVQSDGVSVVGPDSSDRISWAFHDASTDDIDTQSLSSTNVLGTVTSVDTAMGGAVSIATGPGVMDGDTIYMPYIDFDDKVTVATWTSAAAPSAPTLNPISFTTVYGSAASGVTAGLALAFDDTNPRLYWIDLTDRDIDEDDDASTSGGGTETNIVPTITASRISANKLTSVIGLLHDDADDQIPTFTEVSLGAPPPGTSSRLLLMGVGS